jgi:hypothetical protein
MNGEDLRDLPLSMRKANPARLLARRPEGIFISEFEQGEIGPPAALANYLNCRAPFDSAAVNSITLYRKLDAAVIRHKIGSRESLAWRKPSLRHLACPYQRWCKLAVSQTTYSGESRRPPPRRCFLIQLMGASPAAVREASGRGFIHSDRLSATQPVILSTVASRPPSWPSLIPDEQS